MESIKKVFSTVEGWVLAAMAVGGALVEMMPSLLEQLTQGYNAMIVSGGGILALVLKFFKKAKE